MAEGKTGALLGCAAALGAVLGGAPRDTADALDRAGRHLGKPVGGDPGARRSRGTEEDVPGAGRARLPDGPAAARAARPGRARREGRRADRGGGGRTAAPVEARAHTAAARELLTTAPLAAGAAEELTEPLDSLVGRAPWP